MQYVIYGQDPKSLTANKADATALQARLDAAFGYPHGGTKHLVEPEPKSDNTSVAVEIPQVAQWSWVTLSYVSLSDNLTVSEINALQPFQYLVDQQWWGEE